MNDNDTPRRGRRWMLGIGLLLFLFLGVGWYCWPDGRPDAAKKLRKELGDKSLTPEQRTQKWRELRKTMEQMSPAQREAMRGEDRKRRAAEMGKYFRMTQADKNRYLDERIRSMSKMGQGRPGGPGGQGGQGGPGGANRGGPAGGARGVPNGGAAGAPGSGTGGPPSGRTTQARDTRRQDRLDGTTPAERAMFTQFFSDMSARRRQLGIPPRGPFR